MSILCLGLGITFLILEMMMPSIFFLNFGFASFVCAGVSYFTDNIVILLVSFCVSTLLLMYTLRPFLIKIQENKKQQLNIKAKYIGKIATVIQDIDKNSGIISINDERWQARVKNDEIIKAGSKVEIMGNEKIVLLVKNSENAE